MKAVCTASVRIYGSKYSSFVVGCPPRFQAIAGPGSSSRRKAAFRSHDVSVTAVTSQVGHTTSPSDVGAYAASVPKVGAPSHLGPRSRSRPAEVFVLPSRPPQNM